jgi:hypothetical protein
VARISDWGTAIWNSFTSALAVIFDFIPKLIGFIVVFVIGLIVAKAVERAVSWLLRRAHFDAFSERIGLTRLEHRFNMRMDVTNVLSKVVFWFVFLIFLVPAVDALGLSSVSVLLGTIISYLPNVFVAVLLLFLGMLLATFAADIVRGLVAGTSLGNPDIYANVVRYAILGFVALLALYQLNIAPAIVETLFTSVVGALALAFGLAFGLGGRETAQRWLNRGENRLSSAAPEIAAQQRSGSRTMAPEQAPMSQARTAAAMPTDEQLRDRTFSQQPYSEQKRNTPPYGP